jgi:hypothetical protein
MGPDPRYLLLREGMTGDDVRMLMGKPDYYDIYPEAGDGDDCPAWFYAYADSEIILLWGPDGTLHRKFVSFRHVCKNGFADAV